MSHAPSRPRKTVDDYFALPDDVRAELLDGELYVTPSPESRHQQVGFRIARRLARHVEARGLGEVFIAPLDVHLPRGDVVQPDVIFVSNERRDIRGRWIHGVPDLLVEVVSPTHPERDRALKRRRYAENGVPEYWIVDPEERSIEVLRHEGGTYVPAGFFTAGARLASPRLPEIELALDDLFA